MDTAALKVSDAVEGDAPDTSEVTEGEEVKPTTDSDKTETEDMVKEEEPDKTDSVSLDIPADQSDSQGGGDAAAESESAETVPPEGADQPEDEGGT